ncbi:MAG: GNAT family N-acetyltransferase [Pseudonocardia sp.]|nr:GNAT family N-acetyltransferase [Pseudonocardia sp.]
MNARLRQLGPGEYDVLDAVTAGLSATSRYLRFHSGIPRLTPQTRDLLAAVDGRDHLAVAAFVGAEPVGIARLIAIGDARAELAVEVVDAWQHRGIGGRLVRAVVDLGRAAGFREIVADVLADNVAMRLLFASVFPDPDVVEDGAEARLTAGVPAAPDDGREDRRWAA